MVVSDYRVKEKKKLVARLNFLATRNRCRKYGWVDIVAYSAKKSQIDAELK
jgi:hypothetical protein